MVNYKCWSDDDILELDKTLEMLLDISYFPGDKNEVLRSYQVPVQGLLSLEGCELIL